MIFGVSVEYVLSSDGTGIILTGWQMFASFICSTAASLLGIPLGFAIYHCGLVVARGGKGGLEELFYAFKRGLAWKSIGLSLLIGLFTFLWSIIGLVLGFLLAYYTQNVIFYIISLIPAIAVSYRYRQAFYILMDNPEISCWEAIRQSKQMMRGNKGDLFILDISFILWYLLGIVTFGLAIFFVTSYQLTVWANYYRSLKGEFNGPSAKRDESMHAEYVVTP
ncbi:MAG: DUF975 family protein [Firmicutes bacterium]|nr:DUF975 family protein [Bacillota bacterium]